MIYINYWLNNCTVTYMYIYLMYIYRYGNIMMLIRLFAQKPNVWVLTTKYGNVSV